MKLMTEAVDKTRRKENKSLQAEGDKRLTGTRYLWLRNLENLSEKQRVAFDEVCDAKLQTGVV